MSEKKEIFLKDYKKPDFNISEVYLDFSILENKIIVKSKLCLTKENKDANSLVLSGEGFISTNIVKIDKKILSQDEYKINNNTLEVKNVPDKFTFECEVAIDHLKNTALMGIYQSKSCICSQCEPEGFRRITWFLDRPDIMPIWQVVITADKDKYPVLLSNGNLIQEDFSIDSNKFSQEELEYFQDKSIHSLTFKDPAPKPCYLFAFVAGDFDVKKGNFITKKGKNVSLNVFVEKGKKDQAAFALESLKTSMKWDEDTFNLVYEINVFSIVAVSDFNFGAMENTSLNIFNDIYILANTYIATDSDYFNIESIVAHEYFHHFTGNKITCRDWFQLTLKEGLTVYRDHIFSQSVRNKDIVRIQEVEILRNSQFMEDKGALSHPIRPQSYIEMNNFYTSTVYEKGSEVIGMIATIIGEDNFKKGITTYFDLFDGKAVTCEDFIYAMEKASDISLEKFKRWYFQSGTPIIKVDTNYNDIDKTFTIDIRQINNPTADQEEKDNLVIPLRVGLITQDGEEILLQSNGNSLGKDYLIVLEEEKTTLVLENIVEKPVLSINRSFSAPIILDFQQSDEDLIILSKYDSDGFNRFESIQSYLKKHLLATINSFEDSKEVEVKEIKDIISIYKDILKGYNDNIHLTSLLLNMPSFNGLSLEIEKNLPIESICKAIDIFEKTIADTFYDEFLYIFQNLKDEEEEFSTEQMAIRSLKNKVLYYLLKESNNKFLSNIVDYYKSINSMTKKIGVLLAIKDLPETKEHQEIFSLFYNEYKDYHTVLNKWFMISAGVAYENTLDRIKKILELDTFSYVNPNNIRYLLGGFINNHKVFHNIDGSGYEFLAQNIISLDKINPNVAAHLATSLAKLDMHKENRKKLIIEQANKILKNKDISKGVFEVLSKVVKV